MGSAIKKKPDKQDLIDKVSKLTPVHKALSLAGTVLVFVLVFYFLAFTPYQEQRTALDSTQSGLQQNISSEKTKLRNHEAVGTYHKGIDTTYQYIKQFLPQEDEMPRLVQMVSEIGAQAGLSDGVTLFAPKLPAQIKDYYAEIPFTMNLQGEFLSVLKFLYNFSRMDRIINITEVSIGSTKIVDATNDIFHIDVKCSGSTYRFLTAEEIEAKAKKKKP